MRKWWIETIKLPRSCVLRMPYAGYYLSKTGGLVLHRRNAVRVDHSDVNRIIYATRDGKSGLFFRLSAEECPKKERRKNPPISTEAANALVEIIIANKKRNQANWLLAEARQSEALASYYKKQAVKLLNEAK